MGDLPFWWDQCALISVDELLEEHGIENYVVVQYLLDEGFIQMEDLKDE